MANASNKKGAGLHLTTGFITFALTLLGGVLYYLSHKTNYYILGQMNSGLILTLIGFAFVVEIAALLLVRKYPRAIWTQFLTFAVTALLAASAMLIVGDRVEGIGNCIVTDYDSGHGGEEAIYLSLIGAASLLVAMIYNIIASFSKDGNAPAGGGKSLALISSAAVLGLAAIVAAVMLAGAGRTQGAAVGAGSASAPGSSYTVSFNQEAGNIETMPDFQFLSADMGSLLKYDSRSYIDITLKLDGKGAYALVSDYYVLEAGKRAEIGDPSGLGLVYRTTSEGSYVQNGDGTVTSSVPTHVFFELHTDTYSEQMKQLMKLDLNGSDADGDYDSAEYPVLFDYVPETIWTLSGSEIVSYLNPNAETEEETPAEEEPAEEEPVAASAEAVTITSDDGATTLTFNSDGTYRFFFEAYSIEDIGTCTFEGGVLTLTNPKGDTFTAEGDPMKLHYVSAVSDQVTGNFSIPADTFTSDSAAEPAREAVTITSDDGATTLTFNSDGTYRFFFEAYSIEDIGTCTFEGGVLTLTTPKGDTFTAEGDPMKLHYVSAVSDQVTGDFSIPAARVTSDSDAEHARDSDTITSDDGATTLTFNSDGTYRFFFEAYSIEDIGTCTFEGGVLTLTTPKGDTFTAEGDPMKLHYVSAVSDQVTGDFSIEPALLGGGALAEEELVSATVPSADHATTMTFFSDGRYVFAFGSYNIRDEGSYVFSGSALTLTDVNGKETKAEGDSLALHYAYSMSDQLTGDFTVPAALFSFDKEGNTVYSNDLGTTICFLSNGSYRFEFASYSIVDEGSYVFSEGELTLTDANGKESEAEGDPLALHYVYSASDQLTGDYTIPASLFTA